MCLGLFNWKDELVLKQMISFSTKWMSYSIAISTLLLFPGDEERSTEAEQQGGEEEVKLVLHCPPIYPLPEGIKKVGSDSEIIFLKTRRVPYGFSIRS